MKEFKEIMIALLVSCSVFLVTGVAGAASTAWEVRDDSIITFDFTGSLTGNQEFGIYQYGDTTNYSALLNSSTTFVALGYDNVNEIFENGFSVKASNGLFSFYFKDDSGTYYYDITESSSGTHTYKFSVGRMVATVHDIKAVPIPATVFLFGTGLAGLVGLRRRKSNS